VHLFTTVFNKKRYCAYFNNSDETIRKKY